MKPEPGAANEKPLLEKIEVGEHLEMVFRQRRDKWVSSAPDRKSAYLEDGAVAEPGKVYKVVVLQDTQSKDVGDGKLIVRIVAEGSDISEDRWKEVERQVISAEAPSLMGAKRSAEVNLLSELATANPFIAAERAGLTPEQALEKFKADVQAHEERQGREPAEARHVAQSGFESRRAEQALQEEAVQKQEVLRLLGPAGTKTLESTLISLRWKELAAALRADQKIEKEMAALAHPPQLTLAREPEAERRTRSLKKKLRAMGVTNATAKAEFDTRKRYDELQAEREALMQESPEAFISLHLKDLKQYHEQLETGKIVETPYVKQQTLELESSALRGEPVFIYGHLGSGKTELALHAAKRLLNNREDLVERDGNGEIVNDNRHALVVSGSKYMAQSELYGHQVLTVDNFDKAQIHEVISEVEKEFSIWKNKNEAELKRVDSDERLAMENLAHDRILQAYLSSKRGGTISDFYLGPVYQAMEQGRPIIIDEVNAIPHEVLISLNHILTRRPGDTINIQQDSGRMITVKEGFTVIMTGNLNVGAGETVQKYVNREKLDPAFISRLKLMEHDYLPQATGTNFMDQHGNLVVNAENVEKELYTILLASMMDPNGNIEAPSGALKQVWDLANVARATQEAFAGKRTAEFARAGERAFPVPVQYAILSIRQLKSVIEAWQSEAYQKPLEQVIFETVIKDQPLPQERAWLYQQFQNVGFFKEADGWTNANQLTNVQSSFNVKPPKGKKRADETLQLSFYTPRELVSTLYGDVPERKRWPIFGQAESEDDGEMSDMEKAEKLAEFREFQEQMEREIAELDKLVGDHCALELAEAGAGTGA